MQFKNTILAATVLAFGLGGFASAETITIATVNNGDMIIMQKLSQQWEKETGNKINWGICSTPGLGRLRMVGEASA